MFALVLAKAKTIKEVHWAIWAELVKKGWKPSSKSLKVPHLTSPGDYDTGRVYFKKQALYWSYGTGHTLNGARSMPIWPETAKEVKALDVKKFVERIDKAADTQGKFR